VDSDTYMTKMAFVLFGYATPDRMGAVAYVHDHKELFIEGWSLTARIPSPYASPGKEHRIAYLNIVSRDRSKEICAI
jgi:hypothetical protein